MRGLIVPNDGGMSMFFNRFKITNMKAHEFIRETFDLDNRTSISELPDLPISLIVEMLNNYKEGKVKKLLIPRVSVAVCAAPDHVLPCRHHFSGICQYNSHCNFKQTER